MARGRQNRFSNGDPGMLWQETGVMDQRREFVLRVMDNGEQLRLIWATIRSTKFAKFFAQGIPGGNITSNQQPKNAAHVLNQKRRPCPDYSHLCLDLQSRISNPESQIPDRRPPCHRPALAADRRLPGLRFSDDAPSGGIAGTARNFGYSSLFGRLGLCAGPG